jgi:hypothetical protein
MRVGRTGSADWLIIRSRPGFYASLRVSRNHRFVVCFGGSYAIWVKIF